MKWLLVLVLAVSCHKKRAEEVPPAPSPSDALVAIDTTGAIDALSERDALAVRLRGYVELLSIDFWAYQYLAAYPGVPKDTTFLAMRYRWEVEPWVPIEELREKLAAIVSSSNQTHPTPTDEAVHAYAAALTASLPKLLDLQTYYQSSQFVDDEFDRGRRDAPLVQQTRDELAPLRKPMWSKVLTTWRELSSSVPSSPRAVVGAAWETCIAFADHYMNDETKDALNAAVSACRRSIPSVTALPTGKGAEFAFYLRNAAIAIGDKAASSYSEYNLHITIAQLTKEYLALWPTLSTTPAERNVP